MTDGLAAHARRSHGQATLEYALVLFALLASVVALGALWRASAGGKVVQGEEQHASHSGEGWLGMAQDVLLY